MSDTYSFMSYMEGGWDGEIRGCTDMEGMLHFFCDVLGFDLVKRHKGRIYIQRDDREITLVPNSDIQIVSDVPPTVEREETPIFIEDIKVKDIEKAIAHFKQHNVEFENDWQPGDTKVVIRDPDGGNWEVSQEE